MVSPSSFHQKSTLSWMKCAFSWVYLCKTSNFHETKSNPTKTFFLSYMLRTSAKE